MAQLNESLLGAYGIEFFKDVDTNWTPGQQVELVRELLLAKFEGVLAQVKPQHYQKPQNFDLDEYHQIPESAFIPVTTKSIEKQLKARLAHAKRIMNFAWETESGNEDVWTAGLKSTVLSRWQNATKRKPSDNSLDIDGAVAMYGGRVSWDAGYEARKFDFPTSETPLKIPKPDIYIAIRVQEQNQGTAFLRQPIFQNFTFDALSEYSEEGLICCPSTTLLQTPHKHGKHRVCFPFAIVEAKDLGVSDSKVQYGYCQVANASSVALAMLCNLCKYSPGSRYWCGESHEIVPVVAFTFVGPAVKLWLAYVADYNCGDDHKKDTHHFKIQCIWDGDLTKLWDSLKLCCILERLEYWTMHIYKPWLSSHLDHWRLRNTLQEKKQVHKQSMQKDTNGRSAFENARLYWAEGDAESEISNNDHDETGDYDEQRGLIENYSNGSDDDSEGRITESDNESVQNRDHESPSPGARITRKGQTRGLPLEESDISDDELPVSSRTRSRSNSGVWTRQELPSSSSDEKGLFLTPKRAGRRRTRPTHQLGHSQSSPINQSLPIRPRGKRRSSDV